LKREKKIFGKREKDFWKERKRFLKREKKIFGKREKDFGKREKDF